MYSHRYIAEIWMICCKTPINDSIVMFLNKDNSFFFLFHTRVYHTEETTSAAVYNVSYVTNSANPRYSDQEDTESEAESANGSSLENLSSVVLLSENLGDIPIPELHDYILRKHRNTEEGFRTEFKVRMLCFYALDIFIYL